MTHLRGAPDPTASRAYLQSSGPDFEKALKASNKKYEVHIYPDVNHGFHNDTTPRYDKQAAELAWGRTIAFFKEHLG
jgi:carboxymethylenebutenolidase